METITLNVETRNLSGRKTNALRAENIVPAVIYGLGKDAVNVQLNRGEFDRAYSEAGESTVIELNLNGSAEQVLIHDVQFDPLTDFTSHIDFMRIDMNKEVEAAVELVPVGESMAVKSLGGTLVQALEELEVRALPNNLVREIEFDISKLATFDDVLHVSDLSIPAGIEVLADAETVVAIVQPPRDEAEMAELDAPVNADVSKVEVAKEKKEVAE
jgi:large subunit ribosomal protein L25